MTRLQEFEARFAREAAEAERDGRLAQAQAFTATLTRLVGQSKARAQIDAVREALDAEQGRRDAGHSGDLGSTPGMAVHITDAPAEMKERRVEPIKCPRCGSTSWLRVEEAGYAHSEDLIDTATGKANELEDEHDSTDTTYECYSCRVKVHELEELDDPAMETLGDRLLDAFGEATWDEDQPHGAKVEEGASR